MKEQHGNIRYSSWNFIQDILFFVINYFFSFPKNVKKALQSILCLRKDPRPAVDSFPLKIVNTKDLHAFELDQDPFSEFCDEPQATKSDSIPAVHTPTPCKIPDRYKPLVLPSVLHAFPKNYDLYLPRFDSECKNVNAEQHVQNFENFLDLFEVDDEDVSIRLFALSLQAKVKSWFKALPDASISDFQQFVKVFLDRWMIGQNLFLIVEEYNQLKRLPGETVQQFSARFNQVYYSMPADIRPTPRSSLLHYLGAFDPEMEFQLRERDIATLHEMQNSAVNVEAHLLIRRARMKEEEMKNIDPAESTSLEVKLDSLVSAVERMIDKINASNDDYVLAHGSLIEEEQVAAPKHFVSYPSCHRSDNDCFIDHCEEERAVDMMCMFDDDLPRFDQYDDDYVLQTEANLADKSAASLWEEKVHFQQLEYNVQPSHISYDIDEESAANFEVSEGSLPFCFDSCQFIRDNFHAIRNQLSTSLDLDHLESNENFVQDFSYSDLQPPNAIGCQVADEGMEVDILDQMIQEGSLPFCFESFQFLKGNLHSPYSVKNEQHVDNHVITIEPIEMGLQQSCQVFHDPIADVLDEVCSQSFSPLTTCELETCADMNLIRQLVSFSFLAEVSSQGSDQSLHSWYEERSNPLDELSFNELEFQDPYADPYAVFLEVDRASVSFIGSVSKLSWELPFSSSLLLFISENLRRFPTADGMLTWLHWLFHFT